METLHLRWDEYEPYIKHGFSQLRVDGDFYDVTLASGDNKIQAHKVILGACSSFFKSLLKSIPHHQHPFLYLGGIDFTQLESVINFMYNGEVHVKSDELDHFLAVAQELQVKGLMQDQYYSKCDEPMQSTERSSKNDLKRKISLEISVPPERKKIISAQDEDSEIEDITPVVSSSYIQTSPMDEMRNESDYSAYDSESVDTNISLETTNELHGKHINIPKNRSIDNFVFWSTELLEDQISKYISQRDADNNFKCLLCSYSSPTKKETKTHIQFKHFEINEYTPDSCSGYESRNVQNHQKYPSHDSMDSDPSFSTDEFS